MSINATGIINNRNREKEIDNIEIESILENKGYINIRNEVIGSISGRNGRIHFEDINNNKYSVFYFQPHPGTDTDIYEKIEDYNNNSDYYNNINNSRFNNLSIKDVENIFGNQEELRIVYIIGLADNEGEIIKSILAETGGYFEIESIYENNKRIEIKKTK